VSFRQQVDLYNMLYNIGNKIEEFSSAIISDNSKLVELLEELKEEIKNDNTEH